MNNQLNVCYSEPHSRWPIVLRKAPQILTEIYRPRPLNSVTFVYQQRNAKSHPKHDWQNKHIAPYIPYDSKALLLQIWPAYAPTFSAVTPRTPECQLIAKYLSAATVVLTVRITRLVRPSVRPLFCFSRTGSWLENKE